MCLSGLGGGCGYLRHQAPGCAGFVQAHKEGQDDTQRTASRLRNQDFWARQTTPEDHIYCTRTFNGPKSLGLFALYGLNILQH